jgi:hypothetical protein
VRGSPVPTGLYSALVFVDDGLHFLVPARAGTYRPNRATGCSRRNYGCFLVASSSFRSICPISGLDMKFFHTSPVR